MLALDHYTICVRSTSTTYQAIRWALWQICPAVTSSQKSFRGSHLVVLAVSLLTFDLAGGALRYHLESMFK